jgi:hypothetical protein
MLAVCYARSTCLRRAAWSFSIDVATSGRVIMATDIHDRYCVTQIARIFYSPAHPKRLGFWSIMQLASAELAICQERYPL